MVFWRRKKKSPQELMAAGDYKAAIKAFHEVLKEKSAEDPALMMQMATAYLRVGKEKEAKDVYVRVGSYYGDRGFFNKSVAAFKKALNITPGDNDILEKLSNYNDKVPKFMIDENLLARMKKQANAINTGAHPVLSAEDIAQSEVETVDTEAQTVDMAAPAEAGSPAVDLDALDAVEAKAVSAPEPASLLIDDDDSIIIEEPEEAAREFTEEIDREQVMARAKELSDNSTNPTFVEPDHTYEEEHDLDALFDEQEDEFPMNFGDAQPSPATPPEPEPLKEEPPEKVVAEPAAPAQPAPRLPPKTTPASEIAPPETTTSSDDGKLAQPISRGGMVFRSQEAPKKKNVGATGVFSSFDDALDNIFGGDDGEDDGLFGNLGGAPTASPESPEEESVELTLADASPEENARHWSLFRTMPSDVLMAFIMALEDRDYVPGDRIVGEGEPGDEMFLIADGHVDVLVTIGGQPTKVATLGEGDFFGEASVLSGEPRNATVITVEETNCLVLTRADFRKLVEEHPSVMASVESIYYTRLNENASRRREAGS